MTASITMREAEPSDFETCEDILRRLPDWFGIEEAIQHYRADLEQFPSYLVEVEGRTVGFLTLREHNPYTSEIHLMAVDPAHHRQGIGRLLVDRAASIAREKGQRFLEVKTLGPSRPDVGYDRTRRFYRDIGFLPIEELEDYWPGNPCLIMVKVLDGAEAE